MIRFLVVSVLCGALVLAAVALRSPGSPGAQAQAPPPAHPLAEPDPVGLVGPVHPESLPAPRESRRSEVEAPALASEDRVELRVITARSLARDAERVPGIAFEVVRARAGQGADVPVHPDDAPLAAGRSGSDGQATVEFAESLLLRDGRGRAQLRVRVVEPGHQQRYGGLPATSLDDESALEVRVMVVPGATARGRVVDAAGRGVDADVRLRRWVAPQGVRKLGGLAGTRQLTDGWFELDLREDVRGAVLCADARDAGTGALSELDLDLAVPAQDLEIVVHGPGRLRGRVLDSAGQPASGVELLVWLAEFDDEVGSFVSPEPAYSELQAEGGGRLWVTLASGERGHFDVRGLRSLPYVVRARMGQGSQSGYPLLLTRGPVTPGGPQLELELSRPHLAVRLRHADGSEWTGAPVQVRETRRWAARVEEWPVAPTLMVFACTPTHDDRGVLGEPTVEGDALEGRVAGPADAAFEIPDGARYLVGAQGGGFAGELSVVQVPAGAGRVPVELVAPAARELGSVSVRVAHADRELNGLEFDVYLESLDSAAILLNRERYGEPAPFVLTAPAGRYRVVAEGTPFVDSHHGTLMTARELGRVEAEFDVQAGQTRDLLLELGEGGRVELALAGVPGDREAAVREVSFLGVTGVAASAAHARVFLVHPGRRPEPVEYTVEWTGSSAAGTHLESRWPLGETHTSEVLPTGTHTLVARMPGGREQHAEVEITSGATTKVALEL